MELVMGEEKLNELDRMALELAKQKKLTALAQAEKALAVNENAELSYRYVVLQIYMKYGLTQADTITEEGVITRGGALPKGEEPVKELDQ
jgi:hypothetical protein